MQKNTWRELDEVLSNIIHFFILQWTMSTGNQYWVILYISSFTVDHVYWEPLIWGHLDSRNASLCQTLTHRHICWWFRIYFQERGSSFSRGCEPLDPPLPYPKVKCTANHIYLTLKLSLSGGDQMMLLSIIWNSLGDASRHHKRLKGLA